MDAGFIVRCGLGMDGYALEAIRLGFGRLPRLCGRGRVWLAFYPSRALLQPLRRTLHHCLAGFFIGCYICNMDRRCERASIVYPCCNL